MAHSESTPYLKRAVGLLARPTARTARYVVRDVYKKTASWAVASLG
jgi:hypothetical protein